jgi:hypothetical protein
MNNKQSSIINYRRPGVALLVVLFVVMVITITSLAFLSESNVELACGQNMKLRTEMDYTVESGLEHARGLIMSPQDVASEYWRGDVAQQTGGGDDYYDLAIVRDDSNPTDRCNYIIDCNSYRLKGGQKIGRSDIRAELRLDPCIAFWVGSSTKVTRRVTINGDVYSAGYLASAATIRGDVFARLTVSGTGIEGRSNQGVAEPPVGWPGIGVSDYSSTYYIGGGTYTSEIVGTYAHPAGTFNPSPGNPGGIRYRNGDMSLPGDISINGFVVVNGNLIINGSNAITAVKNFPAVLVNGDLIIAPGGVLNVGGLVVIEDDVLISSDAGVLAVTGGLFVRDGFFETVVDSSGNGHGGILCSDAAWRPSGGRTGGALEFDGAHDTVEDTAAGGYLNGLSAITVSLWVKSDVIYQDRGIMFSHTPTDADSDLGIRYDQTGAYGGGVRVIKASVRATSGYTQIESTSNVQTTSWQHLALVWKSGTSLKLYINGVQNPLTYNMGIVSGTITGVSKLMLGLDTKGAYWDGMLDDLRIYNRALDPNQIYPPVDGLSGLLTHWRLDEGGCDVDVTAEPCKAAIMTWSSEGVADKWEQVGGAFFRSIRRQ